jgi:uroporphyrinogen-III synthase
VSASEVPLRVVAFESRRADEIATLIRRHGGDPFVAPALREVPLSDQHAALAFARGLAAGAFDVVILLTGVGTRALVDAVAPVLARDHLVTLLRGVTLVARGPKPVAALRELGVTPTVVIPEPNTWRELLQTLDSAMPLANRRIAVQEYGAPPTDLVSGLTARGARVTRVPVYRWELPADLTPLREAVARLASAAVDVALFTSATQVDHVFRVAEEANAATAVRAAAARIVVGSIGPICSEALHRYDLNADVEPTHPKMGPLVGETLRAAPALLATKRG